MKELFDFLDGDMSEQPGEAHENSQHWLDDHYPFKGYAGDSDGSGFEVLAGHGLNGCGISAPECSEGE